MVINLKTIALAHKMPINTLIFARYDQKTELIKVLKKDKTTGNNVVIEISALLLASRLIDIIREKFKHTVKFNIKHKVVYAYVSGKSDRLIGSGNTFTEAVVALSKHYSL